MNDPAIFRQRNSEFDIVICKLAVEVPDGELEHAHCIVVKIADFVIVVPAGDSAYHDR